MLSAQTPLGRKAGVSPEEAEFFEKQVRPVLVENCFACHSAESKPLMGGLRLDSREGLLKGGDHGAALVAGRPEGSLLVKAIRYADKGLQMPPKGKLSDEQITALTEWVKRGALWPEARKGEAEKKKSAAGEFNLKERAKHWSFQPIRKPAIPMVKNRAWVRTPVDAFILAKLEAKGVTPAPPADKRTLLRRVTYDLIGLPPTPEEIEAFVRDTSPNAYEKVVERLLASPHYGERWARHWLDLARFAETDGHEFDSDKPAAFRYRDYVIQALNADVPYDQFVREQVAGDLLPTPRRHPTEHFNESVIGTGFFWFGEGTHSPVDLLVDEAGRIDNQIDVFGKTFLGLSLGCARCHNHKFDPISTKDYYALSGFLKSSRYALTAIDDSEPLRWKAAELTQQSAQIRPLLVAKAAETRLRQIEQMARFVLGSRARGATGRLVSEPGPEREAQAQWTHYLQDTAARNPNDPLYPWVALSGRTDDFAHARDEVRKTLQAQIAAAQKEEKNDILFEDFHKGTYQDWFVTGEAFGKSPARATPLLVETPQSVQVVGVAGMNAADSGAIADRLQGALRSKTFVLSKNYVLTHLSGQSAQVNLIIDGFQRIRAPIYGGLTIEVNKPGPAQWTVQDVSKWVGHRAYIEFLDHGPGHLAVDRIVFSDRPTPVIAPNPLIVQMLDDPALTSPEALAHRYQALFAETLQQWREDHLDSPDRIEILNGLLRADGPLRPTVLLSDPTLTSLLQQKRALESTLPEPQRVMALTEGTPENDRVHIRGSQKSLGDEVPRRFLEACTGNTLPIGGDGTGRLALAQRLVSPATPLVARVMVNRLWQHHFGEGLVRTPDDFGLRGERPTHPELLDWLASEFVRQGWSLKKMHRLMALSSAYRMASRPEPKAEQADPQNKLLHRMPFRRLEAECIRDAILAVSGRLDKTLYGPSVLPYLTPYMEGRGRPTSSGPLDGNGRRSLYISVRRNFLTPMFLAFDYPVPFNTMGRRTVSNVPAQALILMNNPFVVEQASVWAKRVRSQPGDARTRITRMYLTAFGRPPTPTEQTEALAFLAAQDKNYGSPDDLRSWADLCHVLFNVKEFLFIQ